MMPPAHMLGSIVAHAAGSAARPGDAGLRALGLGRPGIAVAFSLRPQNAAPVFVLGDRHAAFDADADPLPGLGLPREQLLQDGHGFSRFTPT